MKNGSLPSLLSTPTNLKTLQAQECFHTVTSKWAVSGIVSSIFALGTFLTFLFLCFFKGYSLDFEMGCKWEFLLILFCFRNDANVPLFWEGFFLLFFRLDFVLTDFFLFP